MSRKKLSFVDIQRALLEFCVLDLLHHQSCDLCSTSINFGEIFDPHIGGFNVSVMEKILTI